MLKIFFVVAIALTGFSSSQAAEPPMPMSKSTVHDSPPALEKPATSADHVQGSLKMAKVFFIEPKDGANLGEKFHMKFGNEGGMKVVPAGTITPGTGHYHVIIDSGALPEGQVVPTDAKDIHYGKGQTEADLTLPKGTHKLTLQFADGAHRSYGPMMSQTITVHVK